MTIGSMPIGRMAVPTRLCTAPAGGTAVTGRTEQPLSTSNAPGTLPPPYAPTGPPASPPHAGTSCPAKAGAADPDQSERIAHFFKRVQRSTLSILKYMSSAYMGELAGAALGAALLTPHLATAARFTVLVGGLTAFGAAGAVSGLLLQKWLGSEAGESPPPTRKLSTTDALLGVGTAAMSVPSFIYPTINGTEAEKAVINEALDRLPLGDVTSVATIDVTPGLVETGVTGLGFTNSLYSQILLDPGSLDGSDWTRELVTHEVGHTRDIKQALTPWTSAWGAPFGQPPYVSDYAQTNRMEDYAESHVAYHMDRERFAQEFPEKFEAMEHAHRPSLGDLIMDRPSVREAGKAVGDALGQVPHLRTGLELLSHLVAPGLIHRGSRQLEEGLMSGDAARKLDGKLNLATGLMIFSGFPLAGLAAAATRLGLRVATEGGAISAEKANNAADKMLALACGPIGMMGLSTMDELAKSGVDMRKAKIQPGDELSGIGVGTLIGGLLSTVGGAALGMVGGAALGSAVGGAFGASLGMLWGRMTGGVLGLGAFSAYRVYRNRKSGEPPSPLDLRKEDVRLLACIGTGAIAGGIGGSIGGAHAGHTLGELAGQAIGGPTGAIVGGWLGRISGLLLGAYALSKAGAFAGRKLAEKVA